MGIVKLGDLGTSVKVLKDMRDRLIKDGGNKVEEARKVERRMVEDERWITLSSAAKRISEACDDRDLSGVAVSLRELRNKMRRPGVKKALARLDEAGAKKDPEGDVAGKRAGEKKKERETGKDDKGQPTGKCKCAQCSRIIDGSREPCVDDALCVSCALKNKVVSKKDQDKKKRKKAVPPSGMGPEQGGGGGYEQGGDPGGAPGGEGQKEEKNLRRRSYTGGSGR